MQQRGQHPAGLGVPELPIPTTAPARVVAASMSVARSAAVTGSAQPVSGSNVIVDGSPARPTALNTNTGPRCAPQRARTARSRSVRVRGDQDGAGGVEDPAGEPLRSCRCAGRRTRASRPRSRTTPCSSPTRHSRTATSTAGSRHHRHRDSPASDGRTVPARRRIAGPGRHPGDVEGGGDAGLAPGPGAPPGHRRRGPRPPVPPDHRQQHTDDAPAPATAAPAPASPPAAPPTRTSTTARPQEPRRHDHSAAPTSTSRITTVEALTGTPPRPRRARRHQRRRPRWPSSVPMCPTADQNSFADRFATDQRVARIGEAPRPRRRAGPSG